MNAAEQVFVRGITGPRVPHPFPTTHGSPPSTVRYGQVWEDADILLEGLQIEPGQQCLSVASAGDNALALLTQSPAIVLALDSNPAQLACLALRVAAFRCLTHTELLQLVGSRPSTTRAALYRKCRPALEAADRHYWDARSAEIAAGIGHAGRFERYLTLFRNRLLPLVHTRDCVRQLFEARDRSARVDFMQRHWDTALWRVLTMIALSQPVVARFGRDPAYFRHATDDLRSHLLGRIQHALVELEPRENPYLQWMLLGEHPFALPLALRGEHFDTIRDNVDRLCWVNGTLDDVLARGDFDPIDRFNLSDIFEYMTPAQMELSLRACIDRAHPGARLAYWNMLVPRRRPETLAQVLREDRLPAQRLHSRDKAFLYRDFVLEEVVR